MTKPNPVAWTSWRELTGARYYDTPGWEMHAKPHGEKDIPLYTECPERDWVELSKEECWDIMMAYRDKPFRLVIAVQDKLRERNK